MTKLTIPAILAATIMVAGAFAFMPVEQASTVHTTIGILNVADVDGQDLSNSQVILADSATIKTGTLCLQYVDDIGSGDALNVDLDLTADGVETIQILASAAIEDNPADTTVGCADFTGFAINFDAAGSDAADLGNWSIAYREATP